MHRSEGVEGPCRGHPGDGEGSWREGQAQSPQPAERACHGLCGVSPRRVKACNDNPGSRACVAEFDSGPPAAAEPPRRELKELLGATRAVGRWPCQLGQVATRRTRPQRAHTTAPSCPQQPAPVVAAAGPGPRFGPRHLPCCRCRRWGPPALCPPAAVPAAAPLLLRAARSWAGRIAPASAGWQALCLVGSRPFGSRGARARQVRLSLITETHPQACSRRGAGSYGGGGEHWYPLLVACAGRLAQMQATKQQLPKCGGAAACWPCYAHACRSSAHQLVDAMSPTANTSRTARCGSRSGAVLLVANTRLSRMRMQPRMAAFRIASVGFCGPRAGRRVVVRGECSCY